MRATKRDFLESLRQAVMFSPTSADGKCHQLQTFKVLEVGFGGLVRSSNLGGTICDKGKPFFWSRLWHSLSYNPNRVEFDFPVLIAVETGYTVDKPLAKNNTRSYNFNLTVLDKHVETKGTAGCEGCNGRTINEIYEDTESLLFQALHFASKTTYAVLSDGTTGHFNRDMLDAWIDLGHITTYEPTTAPGTTWEIGIKNASAYKASIPAEGLYGNSIAITLEIKGCDEAEYNFRNLPDFGVLSHEVGCKNCK